MRCTTHCIACHHVSPQGVTARGQKKGKTEEKGRNKVRGGIEKPRQGKGTK